MRNKTMKYYIFRTLIVLFISSSYLIASNNVTEGNAEILDLLPAIITAASKHRDCNGDIDGFAFINSCGCVGGNTGVDSNTTCVTSAGQVWMVRNLGAPRVATSINDKQAYGDLYQWGRGTDGHEKRNSSTTTTLSTTDTPGHGKFIISDGDWRTPPNDNLWQGVKGVNNPCPAGFKLPTRLEWQVEQGTWADADATSGLASPLKLVAPGQRTFIEGRVEGEWSNGSYWLSTIDSITPDSYAGSGNINSFASGVSPRGIGYSVRCIKN